MIRRLDRQHGFTLIELLVALGIAVITLVTLLSSIQISKQMNSNAQMQNARDTAVDNIRRYAANPEVMYINALRDTSPAANFYYCVFPGGTCTPDTEQPLLMWDAESPPVPIAGASPSPVWYTLSGAPNGCTSSPGPQCPIQAYTSFIARCPGAACTPGQGGNVTIEVHYNVSVYNDPSVGAHLEPVTGPAVPISGSDIAAVSPTPSSSPTSSPTSSPSPSPSSSPSSSPTSSPSPTGAPTCGGNMQPCGLPCCPGLKCLPIDPDCGGHIPCPKRCCQPDPNQPGFCL